MIIVIYILIIALNLNIGNSFLVEKFVNFEGQYIVYSNEQYDINFDDVLVVKNFNGQIYKTDIKNYKKILTNIDTLSSETIVLKNIAFKDIENLLKLNILETVSVNEDITLYNCYSNKFERYFLTKCGKMNIQVAVKEDATIFIGYPILVDY